MADLLSSGATRSCCPPAEARRRPGRSIGDSTIGLEVGVDEISFRLATSKEREFDSAKDQSPSVQDVGTFSLPARTPPSAARLAASVRAVHMYLARKVCNVIRGLLQAYGTNSVKRYLWN